MVETVGDPVPTWCTILLADRRRYILTDTYPDARSRRTLILFDTQSGQRADLGRWLSPRRYSGEIRCDLHPRWSRDGRQVCFDSLHEGDRQLYVIDIADLVEFP